MALTNLTVARADVIQPTVVLPPASGAYVLGGVCVSNLDRCTQNATVSGFNVISRTVAGGDELVAVTANYSADIFDNDGGLPGAFLGHLSMPGTAQFKYLGRDPSVNPLGTFTTELLTFTFQGMLNGNTFQVEQDPGKPSTGSTTIFQNTFVPPITYAVSGSLAILAVYSFNGSPFTPAPPRTPDLTAVPEAGLSALGGAVLLGVIGVASRRRLIR
jgi:hypothetical protein